MTEQRPPEPSMSYGTKPVRYRGWECSWEDDRHFWTRRGWTAYKGGCDLGAPQVDAETWTDLLEEIDAEEEE